MSWLRIARYFIPTIMLAIEVAEQLTQDKQQRRRFLKQWAENANAIAVAALEEMQDQLEDADSPTTLDDLGP